MPDSRVVIGRNPNDDSVGLWVAKTGFSSNTSIANRRNRNRMLISTDWTDRVPLRVIGAGYSYTNTAIPLGGARNSFGGEVLFDFKPMSDSVTELPTAYYGYTDSSTGDIYAGSEYYTQCVNLTTSSFAIYVFNVNNPSSQSIRIRYKWLVA